MLESLRVRPAICERIRSGPLGVWGDPFIAALAQQGYAPSVQRLSFAKTVSRLTVVDAVLMKLWFS
jgi:hypothetical protein